MAASDVHPVIEAVLAGDAEGVRQMVGAQPGAASARDAHGVSALMLALYRGRRDMADVFRAAHPALDIWEAAALGDSSRVARLLDEDPDRVSAYSADGFTPLHLAVFFPDVETARLLIERGAPVNAVSRNPMQVMPLHSAAAGRNLEIVRLLVAHGADVNARQHGGFTPLHAAAQNGDREMAEVLINAGADPTISTDDGRTAETFARSAGHEALAAWLGSL